MGDATAYPPDPILIGDDARAVDGMVRADPHDAHTDDFMEELSARGHFGGLVQR